MATLTPLGFDTLLNGFAGTTATLLVLRHDSKDAAVVEVRFKRASRFDPPHSIFTGLHMVRQPGQPFIVSAVATGSAAQMAGVRAGDRITAIDGDRIGTMSFGAIASAGSQRRLTLSVERKGEPGPLTLLLSS